MCRRNEEYWTGQSQQLPATRSYASRDVHVRSVLHKGLWLRGRQGTDLTQKYKFPCELPTSRCADIVHNSTVQYCFNSPKASWTQTSNFQQMFSTTCIPLVNLLLFFFPSLLGSLPSWGSSTKEGRGLFVLRWSLFLKSSWMLAGKWRGRKRAGKRAKKRRKRLLKNTTKSKKGCQRTLARDIAHVTGFGLPLSL